MKSVIILIIISFLFNNLFAQEKVTPSLEKAKGAFNSGDMEEARFTLQQALTELDLVIAKEILKVLPTEMADYKANQDKNPITAESMGLGVYVERSYSKPGKEQSSLKIEVVDNSPMVAMINTFLSSPLMSIAVTSGRKTVKIDNYKGMMEMDQESENMQCTIQVPFGDSLLTFTTTGIENEQKILSLAKLIKVGAIASLTK